MLNLLKTLTPGFLALCHLGVTLAAQTVPPGAGVKQPNKTTAFTASSADEIAKNTTIPDQQTVVLKIGGTAVRTMPRISCSFIGEPTENSLRDLRSEDIGCWRRIVDTHLTPDGQWLVYQLINIDSAGSSGSPTIVVLRSTTDTTERRYSAAPQHVTGGDRLQLSPSSGWVAFRTAAAPCMKAECTKGEGESETGLTLVEIVSGRRLDFHHVLRYAFNTNAEDEWIALCTRVSRVMSNAAESLVDQGRQIPCKLVLLHLHTGRVQQLREVDEFTFDAGGVRLAWTGKSGLYLRDMVSGHDHLLDASQNSRYDALTWSPRGTDLAVLRAVGHNPEYSLLVFPHLGTPSQGRREFIPRKLAEFPHEYAISIDTVASYVRNGIVMVARSPLIWREDEQGIFLGIKQRGPCLFAGPRSNTQMVRWHWADARLPLEKRASAHKDCSFSYLSFVSLVDGRFVRLADSVVPEVHAHLRSRYLLGFDARKYEFQANTTYQAHADYYLVDLLTGKRKLLLEKLHLSYGQMAAPAPQLSPDGLHFIYMDLKNGAYIAVDTDTGASRNITGVLPTVFFDPVNLSPEGNEVVMKSPSAPFVQGWTHDGAYILISDYYDVWALPLRGGTPRNLTGDGRYNKTVFSRIDFLAQGHKSPTSDVAETYALVALDEPIYFHAKDYRTMRTGIGRYIWDRGKLEMLHWEDAATQYHKAAQARVYIYSRQTAVESPDYYRIDERSWRPALRLTHINPQQKQYRWSPGAKLLTYKASSGHTLHGVLHLPAGYVAGEPYPAIVTAYEEQSSMRHIYRWPTDNVARWTREGFAVLEASNRPRLRAPGVAAVDGVLAGVHAAVATGIVDPDRLGLIGHSYGGYLTNFIVTRTNRFRAAVSSAGISNLLSFCNGFVGHQLSPCEIGQPYLGGPWWQHWDAYVENSPLFHALRIRTPLLIIHGERDAIVPISQATEMFNVLRRFGSRPVVLLQYVDQRHAAYTNNDAQERIVEFFNHFLKDGPTPNWWSSTEAH